jgi:hypothetical protein
MRSLARNIISKPSLLQVMFNTDAAYVSPAEQVSLKHVFSIVEVPKNEILAGDASVLNKICLAT